MKITAQDIVKLLKGKCVILGDVARPVTGVDSINVASRYELSFCTKGGIEGKRLVESSGAGVVICPNDLATDGLISDDKTLLLVGKPRLIFLRCARAFFVAKPSPTIHSTAIIAQDCKIGRNVSIGPYVVVGKEVIIGDHTTIHAGVKIHDGTVIGKNVTIYANTVIGSDGFGFERNEKDELEFFPHFGRVVIEDDVRVGASTCIDRGTLGDTIIGQGTKIDNLIHVAHNVKMGKHCVVVALSLLGGSCEIGDYSWLAPCVCIRDGIKIGKHALVGMGAVVTSDVPDYQTVVGVPARPISK